MYWQLSDISFDIHVLYFIVFFLMSIFVLAAKLLFIVSYYFLLVQLLNDLYQQSLFVCSCSKRAQGSAIKHQQGIKTNFTLQPDNFLMFIVFFVMFYSEPCKTIWRLDLFGTQNKEHMLAWRFQEHMLACPISQTDTCTGHSLLL